jgi:hypothetical protein
MAVRQAYAIAQVVAVIDGYSEGFRPPRMIKSCALSCFPLVYGCCLSKESPRS